MTYHDMIFYTIALYTIAYIAHTSIIPTEIVFTEQIVTYFESLWFNIQSMVECFSIKSDDWSPACMQEKNFHTLIKEMIHGMPFYQRFFSLISCSCIFVFTLSELGWWQVCHTWLHNKIVIYILNFVMKHYYIIDTIRIFKITQKLENQLKNLANSIYKGNLWYVYHDIIWCIYQMLDNITLNVSEVLTP